MVIFIYFLDCIHLYKNVYRNITYNIIKIKYWKQCKSPKIRRELLSTKIFCNVSFSIRAGIIFIFEKNHNLLNFKVFWVIPVCKRLSKMCFRPSQEAHRLGVRTRLVKNTQMLDTICSKRGIYRNRGKRESSSLVEEAEKGLGSLCFVYI